MQRALRRALMCTMLPIHCLAAPSMPPALVTETALTAYQAGRHDEAARLFEHAARAGNRLAQYHYAMMLYRAEVPMPDRGTPWRWLRKAAAAGLPQAQYQLGLLYDGALHGVRHSPSIAAEWLGRAAAQGHVPAQVRLGSMYRDGEGLSPDHAAAARWYLAAARSGHAAAQRIVAGMYEAGKGMDSDLRQAAYWYRRAAEQGDAVAAERYALVRERLEDAEPR